MAAARKSGWLRWALGFAVVFVVLNVAAWVALAHLQRELPSPYFARLEPSLKTQTLKQFIAEHGPPSLIAIGSSIGDMGFDVIQIDKLTAAQGAGTLGFNFGVNGAGPVVFRELLREIIIPLARPKVVVYGLSAIEFNAASELFRDDQRNFLASPGLSIVREGLGPSSVLRSALFASVPLYQLGELFWPNVYIDSTGWNWLRLKNFRAEHHGHQPMTTRWRDLRLNFGERARWRYPRLLENYTISEQNMSALADIAALCREHNIRLIVVNMPVLNSKEELAGTVFADIAGKNGGVLPQAPYEARLRRQVEAMHVPFLDLGAVHTFPEDEFVDPFHLHTTGAVALAGLVAPMVTSAIRSPAEQPAK